MDAPKSKNYSTIKPSNGDDGEYQPPIIEPSFKEKNGGKATVALNYSSNILLVYRLNEMRRMETVNFTLAMACLVYW